MTLISQNLAILDKIATDATNPMWPNREKFTIIRLEIKLDPYSDKFESQIKVFFGK